MEVLQYDYYFGLHAKESHNKDTLLFCLECIDGNQVHMHTVNLSHKSRLPVENP